MVKFRGHEEEHDYHALDLHLLGRIWPFVRPYRTAFLLCLLSLFVYFYLAFVWGFDPRAFPAQWK